MKLYVDVVLLSGQSARVWGTPDLTVYELRQNAQQQLQAGHGASCVNTLL